MTLPSGIYFSSAEFRCHDGTPYPRKWLARWIKLRDMWDKIRGWHGDIIVMRSGYRTGAYNAGLVGSSEAHQVVSGSKHVSGHAGDGAPRKRAMVPGLHALVLAKYEAGELPELGGIGIYPESGWIHCDTWKAPDGHLRRWSGR